MKAKPLILALGVLSCALVPRSLSAQILNWDPDGTTAGTSVSGNWDTVTTNWTTAIDSGINQVWAQGVEADFSVAADYTVTLTEPITVGNLSVAGSAGALTISGDPANNLTLNGLPSTFSITGSRIVNLTAPVGGNAILTKSGNGTLNLSGSNTWSAGTTLSGGVIGIAADSVLSGGVLTSGPLGIGEISTITAQTTLMASGGPRVIYNPVTLNIQLNVSGSQPLTFTNGNFKINGANRNLNTINTADTILGSNLTDEGAAHTLTKQGTGRLVMAGTDAGYLGGVTASAGTLVAGNEAPFPTNNNNLVTLNGAALDLNGYNVRISRLSGNASGSVLLGTNTLTMVNLGAGGSEFSGVISGSGGIVKLGTTSQVLSGTNVFTGGINIAGGALYLSTNAITGSPITLAAGTNIITISGTGRIGANRNPPSISIVTNMVVLETPMAALDPANGGDFYLAGPASGAGGFWRYSQGSGFPVLAGDNTFTGGVQIDARALGVGHKNAFGTGTLTLGNATNPPSNLIELASTVDLMGANAITNPVTVNQDFAITGNRIGTGFGLELSGPVTLADRLNTIAATGPGATLFSGVISGNGGISKDGAGTITLSGANAYTGSTVVSNGILALTNAGSVAASSDINVLIGATFDASGRSDGTLTVGAGQTLRGSGTVVGTVTVAGTLAPGNSTGTLTVMGNVNLNGQALFEIDKGQAPANDGLATISGTVTGGGTLTVTNAGTGLLAQFDSFQLFTQGVSGFTTVNLPPGYSWDNQIATTGFITVLGTTFPTAPTNVTATLSGSNLNLSWPANYAGGWVLDFSTDFVNWTTIPGSRDVSSISVPSNPADPPTFFRMRLLTL